MVTNYPEEFLLQNAKKTKELNVVVEIEGYDTKFSTGNTFKTFRYGAGGVYGGAGLVYGGLVPDPSTKPLLSLNSGMIFSQKTEPEQGRASASVPTLEFLDQDGFMTNLISPDQQLDEVLGGRQVKVRIGYRATSYPEDYFVVFRGYISDTTSSPTKVFMQLTDANLKRRNQIFFVGKTKVKRVVKNFTPADVDVINDKFVIAGHGLNNNMVINLNTDNALPSPFSSSTDYYVVNALTGSFQLAATEGGSPINITSTGAGTLQFVLTALGKTATLIPLYKVDGFLDPILGPDGTYDPTFTGYIKVADELMSYQQNAIDTVNRTILVTRAARGTVAAQHNTDDDAEAAFSLKGNLIDIALKTQLSGWGGVWIKGQKIVSFGATGDPLLGVIANSMTLPDRVDAVEDYGLAAGDYIYVDSGPNAGTHIVSGFLDSLKYRNKVVLFETNVTTQLTTTALFSSRSQYDTLPAAAGQSLRPLDLDVAAWKLGKLRYAFQADCDMDFLITSPESLKAWIESELLLPVGGYSVTRFGRLSVAFTKPPLASQNLVTLSNKNVINPQSMTVSRGLNSRKYFSEVQYYYDANVAGEFTSVLKRLASDAVSRTKTSTVLPINSKGLRTDLSAGTFIDRRSAYILSRYKNAAYTIKLDVNFAAISQIEASDVVAVEDKGGLQIANLETGNRDLEAQLFEVIERSMNINTGTGTVTLLSQLGYKISDRFGGIAPSSLITGGTTSVVEYKDSFGALFPSNEYRKWVDIIGDRIKIHSPDFTFSQEVTLLGFDASNPYKMLISPPLSSPPQPDWIIDCADYPNNPTASDNAKTKLLYSFIDPTINITGGSSTTVFTVDPARAAEISPDLPVFVRNSDFSIVSSEVDVLSVVGSTVTLKTPIEFTPVGGYKLELIGFIDGSGPYRIL